MNSLPDIQNTPASIERRINWVGVSEVDIPFRLQLRDGDHPINVIAKTEMMCELAPDIRGISMSRFIRTIKPFLLIPIKKETMVSIVKLFLDEHNSQKVSLKFEFKIPKMKQSPVSDNTFPQYYDCSFRCIYFNSLFKFYESVRVQYSAYCPCSAALSGYGRTGYPHSQRAFADILIQPSSKSYIWLENIIDLTEKHLFVVPYPIIKREDEKYIGSQAKKCPMFVEDAIRKISRALDDVESILDWHVRCTHEESIHPSNATAINWKGVYGGFDETTYI